MRFISDNIASPRFYIKSGTLEPVHLQEEERKRLVEGMQDTLTKCIREIEKAQINFLSTTNRFSHKLQDRANQIE